MRNFIFFIFSFFILILSACQQTGRSDNRISEVNGRAIPPPPSAPYPMVKNMERSQLNDDTKALDDGGTNVDQPVHDTEEYDKITENTFKATKANPLSTLSIDVDNASYSNVRRMIQHGSMPQAGAVRIEEMINYFSYDYPQPQGIHPFSITSEINAAPWNPEHQLIHIGLQGKKLDYNNLKNSNLVFLIDASGSMSNQNKLPLLKKSLGLLLNELGDNDRIAIVAYAGAAGLVLPSTPATEKSKILAALD